MPLEQIKIALPTGSYTNQDPRSSSKRLINCFSEILPQTSMMDVKQIAPPITIRRWPGLTGFTGDGTGNPVRGMWEMGGAVYVVIGSNLYGIPPINVGAINVAEPAPLILLGQGIEGGNTLVRMTDNTQCLVILVPGTRTCYTYTLSTGLSQITDPFFLSLGAFDMGFVDSYIVFLALNGREFFNDDGQIVSGIGPITFTSTALFPREFGTDHFVGMAVDHREVLMFGERTSEGFLNAGNPTFSPFVSAPDSFMQIGCEQLAGLSIALQDQSVFWVANDRTVRRRNGQTPVRVSNSGIENLLWNADLTGSYALAPTVAGHPLWVYTMPAEEETIVYDCLTTEWFELQSYPDSGWRPQAYIDISEYQLVGDSMSDQIAYIDINSTQEFGSPIVSEIITQSIYRNHNRITHRRLEFVSTSGEGMDYTSDPQVSLYISDDGGWTFRPDPLKGTGVLGSRQKRTYWWNLGQSRNRVYKFQIADPTPLFTIDIVSDIEVNRY